MDHSTLNDGLHVEHPGNAGAPGREKANVKVTNLKLQLTQQIYNKKKIKKI
jgi:hypothetical protein